MLAPTPRLIQPPAKVVDDTPVPDSYAENISVQDFDENGVPLHTTQANKLRRFERIARIEMEQPRRWGYEGDQNWVARAETGTLLERSEVLRLTGDVLLEYLDNNAKFATEAMSISLRKRTARSEAPVRVWQGSNETRGDKLFADLNRQLATVSGSVRSRYLPESSQRDGAQ